MRTWFGSIVFVVLATFGVASGCGSKPDVINHGGDLDASVGGSSGGGTGTAANGGGFVFGDSAGEAGTNSGTGCNASSATIAQHCEDLHFNCGFVSDPQCGGQLIQCGACPTGQFCGGDGKSRCGDGSGGAGGACSGPDCMTCVPKTCADIGYTCGPAGDDCGGKLDCGPNTCPILGWTCGGGGKPGQCGCKGTCAAVPDCSNEPVKTTSLTGKVYDPAGVNPLYHVFVYVANNPDDPNLKSFPAGISCDVCGATAAGSPLLSEGNQAGTYTDVDGSFTLKNVPVGKGLTLVIQLGRWRRVFKVDVDTPCAATPIVDKTLLMPSKQSQGNIPLMAMVTGKVDSLECVLRKMGIDGSEFTNPGGTGRVQFYLGSDAARHTANSGQKIDTATPLQEELFKTNATTAEPVINGYDMTILACQGGAYDQNASDLAALRNYAASGGRVFATHYSYAWLTKNDQDTSKANVADNWSEVAKWNLDYNDKPDTATGHIDLVSNPKGPAFKGWLEAVNASAPNSGTVSVNVVRHDADAISSVPGKVQQWLYRDGTNLRTCNRTGGSCTSNANCTAKVCSANTGFDCTTNACTGPKVCKNNPTTVCTLDTQCTGNNNACVSNTCVTNTCSNGTDFTGQQIPLHFTYNTPVNLVEDLSANPPKLQCGRVLFSDFHVEDANENDKVFPSQCGKACTAANAATQCGTGGKCVSGYCLTPMTPQEKLLEYMIFDLGSCVPPPVSCEPATTCPAGQDCGFAEDGCGGLIPCGVCKAGETCGGGSNPMPNKCGKGTTSCIPQTCEVQQIECGPAADGCGDKIDSCGVCPTGDLCVNGKCKHVN
ncbi:MAG TPA: hypothetical protein VER96_23805 [Polyangiaceae bacterium]|nr:hypothetical protein [Polyangiaceae bacterium]